MTEPLPETGARTFALKAREVVAELAAPRDAVALGPGIGLDEETRAAARALVQELPKPMAVAAAGLSALAGHLEALRAAPAARGPPPHPGGVARVLAAPRPHAPRRRVAAVPGVAPPPPAPAPLAGA